MDNNQPNQQLIEEARQAQLEKGSSYEVLTNQDGWKYLQEWIGDQIKLFTNDAIVTGFKSHEEYTYRRGAVQALRSLLGEVETAIKEVRDERARQQSEQVE